MIQFRLLKLSIAKGKDKLEKETRSKTCVKIYWLEKHFRRDPFRIYPLSWKRQTRASIDFRSVQDTFNSRRGVSWTKTRNFGVINKVRRRAFNVRLAEGGVGEEIHRMTLGGPCQTDIENEIESTGFEKATRYCSGSGNRSPARHPMGLIR